MAVGANHLALLDLLEDGLPAATGELMPDVEALVLEVVELEDKRIPFAAICTRVATKELEQKTGSRLRSLSLATCFGIDVLLAIRQVVLTTICRPTRPAHVVPLELPSPSPSELLHWL
jgi:hypothetical protein